jgi:hypothetical protein
MGRVMISPRGTVGVTDKGSSARELSGKELARLATAAPDVYQDLMRDLRKAQRHQRLIAWSDVIKQAIGNLSGLGALLVLAAIAWHAIDRGDATQGAAIITSGAVAIVTVFVTGRLTRGR